MLMMRAPESTASVTLDTSWSTLFPSASTQASKFENPPSEPVMAKLYG